MLALNGRITKPDKEKENGNMPTENQQLGAPPPLPLTLTRIIKSQRTINDHVEDAFRALYLGNSEQNKKFRSFLDALYTSQAREGSFPADDFSAALMIREWAQEGNENPAIMAENLTTLRRALHVVANRYNVGRAQRREHFERKLDPASGDSQE